MKIEQTEVYGWRAALRGMRNPKNSWHLSDTTFWGNDVTSLVKQAMADPENFILCPESPHIGCLDMGLAKSLIKLGGSHRKFLRQIMIWADLTLPRAIWTELDTYKVATVRNSCSTMHKLGTKELNTSDFEGFEVLPALLDYLNDMGKRYRGEVPDSRQQRAILHSLKMNLPEGYLQRATYMCSYETAIKVYYDRASHRMPEWREQITPWIERLPYMQEFLNACPVP